MKKLRTLLVLGVGFLLGSKVGHGPYDKFMGLMRRLRQTRLVSAPIEATAARVSGAVREKGFQVADRVADATYRGIAGGGPVVVEARVIEESEPYSSRGTTK